MHERVRLSTCVWCVTLVCASSLAACGSCRSEKPAGEGESATTHADPDRARPSATHRAISADAAPARPTSLLGRMTHASECNRIKSDFRKVLDSATGTCKVDDDCGCYNGVAGDCGGVTDKATSTKLAAIEAEFHKERCSYDTHCAAWACAPKCRNGTCVR